MHLERPKRVKDEALNFPANMTFITAYTEWWRLGQKDEKRREEKKRMEWWQSTNMTAERKDCELGLALTLNIVLVSSNFSHRNPLQQCKAKKKRFFFLGRSKAKSFFFPICVRESTWKKKREGILLFVGIWVIDDFFNS